MDVLVALGTSAAYFYSVLSIVLHLLDANFTSHLYFETSALLITFIMLGRCVSSPHCDWPLDPSGRGLTSDHAISLSC
jgi:cation transport ATPase